MKAENTERYVPRGEAMTTDEEARARVRAWIAIYERNHPGRDRAGASYESAPLLLSDLRILVATPEHQSENGSCWDQGPTLRVTAGECSPMPPLCELPAGHLGAHREGRTEWMRRENGYERHESVESLRARAEAAESNLREMTTRAARFREAWEDANRLDDATVKRIRALHQPKKIWESERMYTLVCSSCQLTAYPCPTVATLTPDGQEEKHG